MRFHRRAETRVLPLRQCNPNESYRFKLPLCSANTLCDRQRDQAAPEAKEREAKALVNYNGQRWGGAPVEREARETARSFYRTF
jgi:hypothetical protein